MDIAGVKITCTTLARGRLLIHLVECNVCGPVAVDTTGRPNMNVAAEHLTAAHMVGGVPA